MKQHYYLVTNDFGICVRLDNGDGHSLLIPQDESNADLQAYQEWLAEGNTPEPWPPRSRLPLPLVPPSGA